MVVEEIVRALRPCCEAPEVPEFPGLLRLYSQQHLWSPGCCHVKSGVLLARSLDSPGVDLIEVRVDREESARHRDYWGRVSAE